MSPLKFACMVAVALGTVGFVSSAESRENVCLQLIEHHCDGNATPQVLEACLNKSILTCAKPAHCLQASETGMCRAAFPRFYHNAETGACEQFIYGGCGGNTNNFVTEEECNDACAGIRYCGGNTEASCPANFDCMASEEGATGTCVPMSTEHKKPKPGIVKKPLKEQKTPNVSVSGLP